MKRHLIWCSLLAVLGVPGLVLGSGPLTAFLLFGLLLALIPLRVGDDFSRSMHTVTRWTLIVSLFAFTTVFALAAILAKVPMIVQQMQFDILLLIMIHALAASFVLTIGVFVAATLGAALRSARRNSATAPG